MRSPLGDWMCLLPQQLRTYTMEEVAAHNTREDVWVVLKSKVRPSSAPPNAHAGLLDPGSACLLVSPQRNLGRVPTASPRHIQIAAIRVTSYVPRVPMAPEAATEVPLRRAAQVYDVSSYVEEHPGGDAILNNAGGDSTKEFFGCDPG
jgi:hypothetical protein